MTKKIRTRVLQKALTWVLLSSMTSLLPGCSFLFTTAPKSADTPTAFATKQCTTSKAAPIVDTVIAGLEGVRTGVALAADKSAYDQAPISREADIALGLGFLALFGASAIYGYYITGECSARHDRAVIVHPARQPEKRETWDPENPPPATPRSATPSDDGA